ncbi:MAG: hypothetical protein FWD13_01885 [Treponema sp.]|nr:hypothetical protein [Treponema sp.]
MKIKFSNLIWGTFLLLAAAFLLFNQFDNFIDIGIGSIIVSILALTIIVQCIANMQFYVLPIPLAVLYYIFQIPLNLPYVKLFILIIASILASIGLAVIFPRKRHGYCKYKKYIKIGDQQQMSTEDINNNNNPSVSVNFGAISRRLNSDNLETVILRCNFGALEVFFDKVILSPNGAEADLNCSFGAIILFVPRNWNIIDRTNCSLGGVDIDKNFDPPSENAQQLTLTGNVSLGGIEVRYI